MELIATKPIDTYSKEQLENIRLLSTTKDLAIPFGSAAYRVQKYPGDLDLLESFIGCCSIQNVVDSFAKRLMEIANNIKQMRLHYFSEFKAGLDKRYDIDIGEINNGLYKPNRKEILKKINELYEINLLDEIEYSIINKILSIKSMYLGGDEYDVIYYIFRNRKVIRWNLDEVINGIKLLPGNVSISLTEALKIKTSVKIDVISFVDGRFVEVTNFFFLLEKDKSGKLIEINLDYNFLDKNEYRKVYDIQIKNEIEKLYYSNIFYSPFKMAKRMWAYSRTFRNIDEIKMLTPLVTGNISSMYQIKSEIDTISRIFELTNKPPIAHINNQLSGMKNRLSNIIELETNEIVEFNSYIDNFINSDDKKSILNYIKKFLVYYINMFTILELNKINHNPPPKYFLPTKIKYAPIKRSSFEIVINPLEQYKNLIKR